MRAPLALATRVSRTKRIIDVLAILPFGFLTLVAGAYLLVADIALAQPAGSPPQVPISYGQWQALRSTPWKIGELGKNLPPVAAETGPVNNSASVTPAAGTWSNLTSTLGINLSNPLLLTDGTVIVHKTDTSLWYKLTPDSSGSYINGTWNQIAGMPSGYGPKFHASAVLPNGHVIIEGGEYNLGGGASWTNQGAIYDPVANTWKSVSPPSGWSSIGDAQSVVLSNGTFMIANCCSTQTALFNESNCCTASAWTATGSGKNDWNDEESWSLLPDGTVLTVDAYVNSGQCGANSERYNPSNGTWSTAGNTPSILSDCSSTNAQGNSPTYEIGPQVLMYNGKVIAFGGNTANVAHTALYDTSANTWSAGPDLPQTCGSGGTSYCTLADAPATLMPNGKVLFVASAGAFNAPAKFFEYDPGTNGFAAAPGTADASSITSFYVNFLTLPTGQILAVETYTSNIQIYTPSGSYQSAWQPTITSLSSTTLATGMNYTVYGTQLNGLSQAANYGDDQQAATNYPLVRITNNSSGHVFYARTFNHSTMSVAANTSGSTSFTLPNNIEAGASQLVVVANGIPSQPTSVTVTNNNNNNNNQNTNSDAEAGVQMFGVPAVLIPPALPSQYGQFYIQPSN